MKQVLFLVCYLCTWSVFSWNAEGHQIVAQIALDHMTAPAKARFQVAHPILDKNETPPSFIEAAAWFDQVRGVRFKGIDQMHYVDIPIFSIERQANRLPPMNRLNALMAFSGSRQVLLAGEKSALEQTIALRILLHVTADLHQPLHAATRITRLYPRGDAGGNKVRLPKNKVTRNLHAYWDRGGGFLSHRMPVRMHARALEKMWPCHLETIDTDPIHWLAESHMLAVQKVYTFNRGRRLSDRYQNMVYEVSQKRLAQAGCRLAAVLNEIDTYGTPVVG